MLVQALLTRPGTLPYDCSCDLCSCTKTVSKPDGICSDCLKAEHRT